MDDRTETRIIAEGRITARKNTVLKHRSASEMLDFFDRVSAHLADPWASMERYTPAFELALDDLLQKAGPGSRISDFKERADLGWYYHALIREAKEVREYIDAGNAGMAACRAAHWGEKFSELQMILAREKEWETGHKQHQYLDETRTRTNFKRQAASLKERQLWQAEADLVWAKWPKHSKSAVAAIVRTKLKLAAAHSTIRQALKKPDKAG